EYTIEFDFKKDTSASVGKAIYFSSSLIVDIKEDGITVAVTTDQGTVWLKPSGIGINDTEWHTFSLTFSGVDGVAKLYMDGQVVASAAELDGAIQVGRSSADFYVGDPFGTGFDGVIDDVEFVRYAKTEEEIQNPGSQSTQSASYETAQDETAQQQENDSEEPTVESAEGADVLTGGAGADTFTFDSVEDSAPDRRDVLENFNASEGDKIFLDGLVEGDISFIGDNEFSLSGTQEQKLDIAAKNFGSGSVNLGRPDDFFNLDDMTLSVTFELNDLTSGKQALLWNHAQYGIMIEDNDLQVALRTDDGSLSYLKFPNALDDAGWHDVQVVMDSVAGTLDIWLDGDVLHSGSNVGYDINAGGSWDVTAGSKLGGSLLNGKIADVSIIDKVIDFNADGLAFDRMVEIDQDDDNTALDLATGDTQVRFDDETKILSVDLDGDLTADMEMELVGVNLQDLDNSNFLI
ncbi:MAG: LamG-like jellyroll fold domain-containing protein, partial [Sneathiella sp.]